MSIGLVSCGSDGKTPYIGENGNWWIDSRDLGVPAHGEDGDERSVRKQEVHRRVHRHVPFVYMALAKPVFSNRGDQIP